MSKPSCFPGHAALDCALLSCWVINVRQPRLSSHLSHARVATACALLGSALNAAGYRPALPSDSGHRVRQRYMLDREWQLDFDIRCFNIAHVLIDTPKYMRDINIKTFFINCLISEGRLEISRTVPEERYYF